MLVQCYRDAVTKWQCPPQVPCTCLERERKTKLATTGLDFESRENGWAESRSMDGNEEVVSLLGQWVVGFCLCPLLERSSIGGGAFLHARARGAGAHHHFIHRRPNQTKPKVAHPLWRLLLSWEVPSKSWEVPSKIQRVILLKQL
jgi:hypothetical protein